MAFGERCSWGFAAAGHYEATTLTVDRYETELAGSKLVVFDSPGLCDAAPEEGKDEKYIALMKKRIDAIDVLWFVSPLDNRRVGADEIRAIRLITQAFSPKVWEHAVIVFTFAGSIEASRFPEAVRKRSTLLRMEIAKAASISNDAAEANRGDSSSE